MEKNLFFEANQQLCNTLELNVSLKNYFDLMIKYLPMDGIFINKYRPQYKDIQFLAHANKSTAEFLEQQIPLPQEYIDKLQDPQRPLIHIINDITQDPVTNYVALKVFPDIKSIMLLRMTCEQTHLGVVGFYSKKTAAFNAYHAQLIEPFSHTFSFINAFHLKNRNQLQQHTLADNPCSITTQTELQFGVIGAHGGLKQVMQQVTAVAQVNTHVLLLGETGCGKEVIANSIHQASNRHDRAFVKINCGAIPESLIDSELFGYEKGAFTGAETRKAGCFEQANGGTIFLDEIGELPLSAQVRLLRVLQNNTITRVGSTESVQLDIRVIAATHRDLYTMVLNGEFRQDLWYRLAVFPIDIPALRQRKQDIPLLIQFFLEQLKIKFNLPCLPQIATEQLTQLQRYSWPGNVRELINVLERAVIQAANKPLNFDFLNHSTILVNKVTDTTVIVDPSHVTNQLIPLDEMTKKYIEHALKVTGGKLYGPAGAAELLDINPNTLRSKMKKLGIN